MPRIVREIAMSTAKRTTAMKRTAGQKRSRKQPAQQKIDHLGPAKVWVDRWVTDPTTGK
jgi:hypothetical protein